MENSHASHNKDKEIKENLPQNQDTVSEPLKDVPPAENEEFIGDGIRFDEDGEQTQSHGHENHPNDRLDPEEIKDILDDNEGYETRFPAP